MFHPPHFLKHPRGEGVLDQTPTSLGIKNKIKTNNWGIFKKDTHIYKKKQKRGVIFMAISSIRKLNGTNEKNWSLGILKTEYTEDTEPAKVPQTIEELWELVADTLPFVESWKEKLKNSEAENDPMLLTTIYEIYLIYRNRKFLELKLKKPGYTLDEAQAKQFGSASRLLDMWQKRFNNNLRVLHTKEEAEALDVASRLTEGHKSGFSL